MNKIISNRIWRLEYVRAASDFIFGLPVGAEFVGEDLRFYAVQRGIGHPSHHNGWSGMARTMLAEWRRIGLIEPTGAMQSAYSEASRNHACPVYRVT